MAKEVTGQTSCCLQSNLMAILSAENADQSTKNRALHQFEDYVRFSAIVDEITTLASNLANAVGHNWTL
jgi:hypothetical protein